MSLICQSYFPSCTPLATPSYPCKSSCLASVNVSLLYLFSFHLLYIVFVVLYCFCLYSILFETRQSCGSIWSVVDEPLPLNCSSNLLGSRGKSEARLDERSLIPFFSFSLGGVWPTSHCTTSVFSEAETTNNSTPLPIRTCPSVYAVRASLQDNGMKAI